MRSIPEPTRLAKTRSARTSLALCLGIGVGLVGAAIWQFVYGITGAGSSKLATASVTASAVYPDYPNLRRLTNASTTVVRATAQLVHPSYREVPKGIPTGLPARKASAAGIIKTDVDFRVDHVIWGKAPNTLRVIHLGGNAAGQKLIVEGEPISKVGGSYVLFLRKQPDQKYGIVGGAQGRYAIRGGRLRLVSADVANAPVPKALVGLQIRAFESSFRTLLKARNFAPPFSAGPKHQETLKPTPNAGKPPSTPGQPPPKP